MRRALGAAVVSAGVLLLGATPAHAFSCVRPDDPLSIRAEGADAVFSGRVVEIDDPGRERPGIGYAATMTVGVDAVFKGEIHERTQVVTPGLGTVIGFGFQLDRRYLFLADSGPDAFIPVPADVLVVVGACGGVRRLDDAPPDRTRGLTAYAPLPGAGPPAIEQTPMLGWATGALGVGLALVPVRLWTRWVRAARQA